MLYAVQFARIRDSLKFIVWFELSQIVPELQCVSHLLPCWFLGFFGGFFVAVLFYFVFKFLPLA